MSEEVKMPWIDYKQWLYFQYSRGRLTLDEYTEKLMKIKLSDNQEVKK